jgi:saccharopine dehydrogenase-like NADP-dependent oxidoreductase
MKPRVLVLGGYGHFGARIVRSLARDDDLHVIAAGRDPSRGQALLADQQARVGVCRLDIDAPDFSALLKDQGACVVIHTAGPFQGQGYGVARACLEARQHYIDLADGRAFVRDFRAAMNPLAQRQGCVAISGASTLPALSSAVVDQFLTRFDRLDAIQIVIAPAQRTPLGQATVRAVLSYCGRRFDWLQDGAWQGVVGWRDLKRVRFAHMATRLAAPCDVPDHDLLASRYRGVRSVQFRAAPELPWLARALSLLAALRSMGLPLPMEKLAPVFSRAARLFDRWGSELGGMYVELRGLKDGRPKALRWDLSAPHLHGPQIPCMAAILLARRIALGGPTDAGAHACTGLLRLADFDPEFARWGMTTGVSDLGQAPA